MHASPAGQRVSDDGGAAAMLGTMPAAKVLLAHRGYGADWLRDALDDRTIRPIALNQKNALFTGDDPGAENWAIIASLIETCRMNAGAPHTWLAKTLTAIVNGHTQSQIADLVPSNYAIKP